MSGKRLDDFRLVLAGREFVPIVQGGMGMDISTRNLAVAVAALGGIAEPRGAQSRAGAVQ